jgi:hypothetical protein
MENELIKKQILNKMDEINKTHTILNCIHYNSQEELNNFLYNITEEQSIFCILESIKLAYTRGAFSIEETEIISRCIRLLQK